MGKCYKNCKCFFCYLFYVKNKNKKILEKNKSVYTMKKCKYMLYYMTLMENKLKKDTGLIFGKKIMFKILDLSYPCYKNWSYYVNLKKTILKK